MEACAISAGGARDSGIDVMLAGTVFLDIVFTGLPSPPAPGTEIWTEGMGSSPGGIANLAVATSRLGLRTALAAAFSADGYGQWCWGVLADQEGVDLSYSRFAEDWHSPVTVSLAYGGDRAMVTHGHRPPWPSERLVTRCASARAVIVSLESAGETRWWDRLREGGALVFADVGWDPSGAWDPAVLDLVEDCHCFTPNAVEAQAYTRTATPEDAARALGRRVPLAVVTRGPDGAIAFDAETGELVRAPGLAVPALDPTGAGDVFGAALVAGTLGGWPLACRLRFAVLASALAVQQFGGSLAAPGWGDIADWWQRVSARAAAGHPRARRLAEAYAFLAEILPHAEPHATRRAEATIARLSDVHAPHAERTS
jgi:sugar/nucleoside kinase (ribokinase family)